MLLMRLNGTLVPAVTVYEAAGGASCARHTTPAAIKLNASKGRRDIAILLN
jgi:hypothetical protein